MRVLYHFQMSPFSRRARLALAHKGLDIELRDGRVDATFLVEAQQLSPIKTMPVLVDEARVIADSGAIAQYLDLAYPDRPSLWPRGPAAAQEALAITTAVDVALDVLVNMGTRNWDLRNDPAWSTVLRERTARAQAAIDSVAAKATRPFFAEGAWSAADIWALSFTLWMSGLPARAPTTPSVAQILTLGLRLPDALIAWVKQHEARPDVKAIYG